VYSKLNISLFFAAYKEQLMALGIVPGDQDYAAKAFADLKAELAKERATQETAWIEVDTLTWAVEGTKITADKFAVQILALEERSSILKTR
jgi:hypothetical protein